MKTKLVAILTILLFSGIFTACSEEEINPSDAIDSGLSTGTPISDTTKDSDF